MKATGFYVEIAEETMEEDENSGTSTFEVLLAARVAAKTQAARVKSKKCSLSTPKVLIHR